MDTAMDAGIPVGGCFPRVEKLKTAVSSDKYCPLTEMDTGTTDYDYRYRRAKREQV